MLMSKAEREVLILVGDLGTRAQISMYLRAQRCRLVLGLELLPFLVSLNWRGAYEHRSATGCLWKSDSMAIQISTKPALGSTMM